MLTLRDKQGNTITEVYDERYDCQMCYVATHLRAEDFNEVFAATGESPHLDVLSVWAASSKRFMIFDKNCAPVAVLGVKPMEPYSNIGVIWLLGTDGLNKMKKFFLKITKRIIKELSIGYDMLYNLVDSRYTKTIRWLEWCGFTIDEPSTYNGELAVPFHHVYLEVS
jgi:hypothetical protein